VNITKYLPSIVLAVAMAFFAYDIAFDLRDGTDTFWHLGLEAGVFLAISIVLAAELRQVRRLHGAVRRERARTARLAGEMLSVIREQFDRWTLSASEAEVALLLVKGLSMKEIAEVRQVKEKTVRSQAASVYAKAGCAGRHELAAFFIEDLLVAAERPDG
jgi:DNA-binding CsgD family transcriptional regulator